MKPLIGIVMDWQARGSFNPRPHYAIRDSYFQAIWEMGGLPVGIPLLEGAVDAVVAQVNGVIIPGGDYPSPSRWYGDGHGIPDEHPRTMINEKLMLRLIERDVPLLAICAGHQELCAATGGLLHWRVEQSVAGASGHRSGDPARLAHKVNVKNHSLLHKLVQKEEIEVNSHHNEAVKTVGDGVIISGNSTDGVIEAIEIPDRKFVLGVQWHPEYLLTEADRKIIAGLIEAARAT